MVVAIVLGAMGAHALERHLTTDALQSFETGVRYHIYHAMGLLIVASMYKHLNPKSIQIAIKVMLVGLACFSGSIYLFTIGHLTDISLGRFIWWVTPLGGLLLILSWLLIFRSSMTVKK